MTVIDTSEEQSRRAPAVSVVLGTAAIVPQIVGSLASLILVAEAHWITQAVTVWSAAVLCFLGGVRRGLSFRQPGGPTLAQLAGLLGAVCLRRRGADRGK